jgi:hypothetical protein
LLGPCYDHHVFWQFSPIFDETLALSSKTQRDQYFVSTSSFVSQFIGESFSKNYNIGPRRLSNRRQLVRWMFSGVATTPFKWQKVIKPPTRVARLFLVHDTKPEKNVPNEY